jgi:FkbM family methyltransferase
MVSIRKAKQGFQLRRNRNRRGFGQYDKEKVGLIAAGLCIGIFMVFLYSVAFSDSNNTELGVVVPESLRKTKQHPILMEETNDDGNGNGNGSDNNNNNNNNNNGGSGSNESSNKRISHPPKIVPMGDIFNSVALDIAESLDCTKLLEEAAKELKKGSYGTDDSIEEKRGRRRRRRLQQHGDDGGFGDTKIGGGGNTGGGNQKKEEDGDDSIPEEKWGDQIEPGGGGNKNNGLDDIPNGLDDYEGGGYGGYVELTAKHLFCIAASESPPKSVTNAIRCDAANKKRRTLLDLWSAARSQMEESLFLKVLDIAKERNEDILGVSYDIWAPSGDEGVQFMVNTLNSDQDVDNGGINGLEDSLGPGKIFVDVGSCLGLTCLAVNAKYPGTKIVSIEPASPSWLLQELNLRCNLRKKEFKNIHVILAGVGPNTDDEDNMMAKLMWRQTSTTSTRSWTPSEEFSSDDVELIVRLRKLKSILAEADVIQTPIDVMNLDCQGCEYNVIPALTEKEYEEIPTVMGGVHWGYITPNKLPSSARGKTTHERLCGHENIAKNTKECCAFPDLPVKSSVPGEVLQKDSKGFPPSESTVSDVIAENLCDDFSTWSKEHYLNDIPDDFGWFELSSQA